MFSEVKKEIVGFEREIRMVLAALKACLPVMLEGDAGTGKTELAKVVARSLQREIFRVDGDSELTALKLQGWFDPPLVLQKGYQWETFIPGPLTSAMLNGGIFFFNEVNRAPSESLNAVLSALDERILNIPRLTPIRATEVFVSIFTMNPFDRIGTNPLPKAFYDRCVWIYLDHQPLEKAIEIVRMRTGEKDADLVRSVCQIVEGTRNHPLIERGASVRAAIHIIRMIQSLDESRKSLSLEDIGYLCVMALSKNIKPTYDTAKSPEELVKEILEEVMSKKKTFHLLRGSTSKVECLKRVPPPSDMISMGEQALMEGRGRSLKEISRMNPKLAKRLVEKAGKFINTYWSHLPSQDMIQVYRNIKSIAQREERRRLLEYLVPRVILEGHRLYNAGLRVKMNESRPYRPGEEWDYEATLESMFSAGILDPMHLYYELIRAKRKSRTKRAFIVIADKSSSLTDWIHLVAVGTGMIAYAAQWDFISVVVFDKEVEFLKHFHETKDLGRVIEQIIDMDSGGATDLFKPLEATKNEFAHIPLLTKKRAILISDCIPTMGRDPLAVASQFESLNIFYFPHQDGMEQVGLIHEFKKLPNIHIFPINRFDDFTHGIYEVFMQ
jgi:MoxR-like ATPase